MTDIDDTLTRDGAIEPAALEALLLRPRERASVLVRRLDTLEGLRRQAALCAQHLGLPDARLAATVGGWALRLDEALRRRIVA